MNFTAFSQNDVPYIGVSHLELTLIRLGAWIDAERERVGDILAQSGWCSATAPLDTLDQLHLGPDATEDEIWQLLQVAENCLTTILKTLDAIPTHYRADIVLPPVGPVVFNARLCRSQRRLKEILGPLRRVIAV